MQTIKRIFFSACAWAIMASAWAEVAVYPAPTGIPGSAHYQVTVIQNQQLYPSFVYANQSTLKEAPQPSADFTNFSFSGTVTVQVTCLFVPVDSVIIRPKSRGIKTTISGKTITFVLNRPANLSVEINGSSDHPLLLFANPREKNAPKSTDKSVVYFAPGVHDVGEFVMPEGKTGIYLAGGAYVKGKFELNGKYTISGRGIVSGESYIYRTNVFRSLVQTEKAEGITIIHTPYYNLRCREANNVKAISWYGQTDGVHIEKNGRIENCFFKVNDDAFKLYNSHIRVKNCVVWQMFTGAPFQLSWNLMGEPRKNIVVDGVDIIHTDYKTEHINRAIVNSVHGGDADIDGVTLKNIRIEGDTWRLVMLTLKRTRYGSAKHLGNIRNITLQNVSVEGKVLHPNVLHGIAENGIISRVGDITLKNITVNGHKATTINDAGGWQTDDKTTGSITIK